MLLEFQRQRLPLLLAFTQTLLAVEEGRTTRRGKISTILISKYRAELEAIFNELTEEVV